MSATSDELAQVREVRDTALARVAMLEGQLAEQRQRTWEAWEREAVAAEEWLDLAHRFVEKSSDLHTALCQGAFKIERDPMEMQGVFMALQDGHVSTGFARTALRRWLAGLPVDRVPAEPEPESASALQVKAEAELEEQRGLTWEAWEREAAALERLGFSEACYVMLQTFNSDLCEDKLAFMDSAERLHRRAQAAESLTYRLGR
ncbi:MAG: hypothetical protein EOO74_10500, partial [Myxococcales bacterium]